MSPPNNFAMSGAVYAQEEKMAKTIKRKSKGIKIEVDHQKLAEAVLPRLVEAVTKSFPNAQTYEAAIGELNMANKRLKDLNDKMVGEFSATLEEFDNRLRAIETKLGIESPPELASRPTAPEEAPTAPPAPEEAPQNPA